MNMEELNRFFMQAMHAHAERSVVSQRKMTPAEIDQHAAFCTDIDALRDRMMELEREREALASAFWGSMARQMGFADSEDLHGQSCALKIENYNIMVLKDASDDDNDNDDDEEDE